MSATVKCPTCKKTSSFSPTNQFRPFCSERCKLIDLGQWSDESYTLSSPLNGASLTEEQLDEIEASLTRQLNPPNH